jgi:hypothetical protein
LENSFPKRSKNNLSLFAHLWYIEKQNKMREVYLVKKRLMTLILCVLMLASLLVIPGMADSAGRFQKTLEYDDSIFTDIAGHWFYADVADAYEYGLVEGRGNNLFAPDDTVSLAEALTVAARINAIYYEKTIPEAAGKWYMGYVNYAVEAGILNAGQFNDYERAATRSELAALYFKALPESEFLSINNVYAIPDVPNSRNDSTVLYTLYRAGVLAGVDEARNCKPDETVKRSEAVTLLDRVIDQTRRVEFSLGTDPNGGGNSGEDPVKPEDNVAQFAELTANGGIQSVLTLYPTSQCFKLEFFNGTVAAGAMAGGYESMENGGARCIVSESQMGTLPGSTVTIMSFALTEKGMMLTEVYPKAILGPDGVTIYPITKVGTIEIGVDVLLAVK